MLKKNKKNQFTLLLSRTVSVVAVCLLITSCTQQKATEEKFTAHQEETDAALKRLEPKEKIRPALLVENTPWYGRQSVRMRNGDQLPDKFVDDKSLVVTFERALSLQELGRAIQVATGMRIVVIPATSVANTSVAATQGFLPLDGAEVAGGRVVWQGNLQDLLNQIGDAFDVSWSYQAGVIKIQEEITNTFMLHALAGNVDVSGSVQTGSTGQAGNLPTQSVGTEATLSLWDEIQDAVEGIVSGAGRVTFSPASGTVTVSGKPSMVRKVEEYLRYQNRMRLRRVAVTVRALSVEMNDDNNVGFDLQGVLEDGINGQPIFFSSTAAGGLSSAIIRDFPDGTGQNPDLDLTTGGAEKDSVQAVITAIAEQNKVSIVHTGTVITLSDQPAPLQVSRQVTYIARVSASAAGDSSSTSLEPGTVEEGLTLNVLPRVIEKSKVLLRLGIGITQIREIVDFQAGDLTVQLPDLDTTGFLQNIMLSSGETLVLSGFERNRSRYDEKGTGVPKNIFLGGSKNAERQRNATVLLITTDILPEDPFGVVKEQ